MTTSNTKTEASASRKDRAKLPTHAAKVRRGFGRKATYERIGVAWRNDDGSLYVKLAGTQVVSALTLYELHDRGPAGHAALSDDGMDEEGE